MPKVPTYQAQVSSTALPAVRQRTDFSPDEFGAGLGRALQRTAGTFAEVAREERRRAEEAQTLEFDAQLAETEKDLLYNPQSGALTRKGSAAFGVDGEVLPAFDKRVAELTKGLASPRMKQVGAALAARRRLSVGTSLQRHIFGETQAYEKEKAEASRASAIEMASLKYADAAAVAAELARGEDAVRLQLRGSAPEAVDAALLEFRSGANTAIVERMLADRDYGRAESFLAGHRDQFEARAYQVLKNRVDGEVLGVKAETGARALWAEYGQNLSAAYKAIDRIEDKDLRDKTRSEFQALDARQEHLENRAKSEARQALQDWIDAGNDPAQAPLAVRNTLGSVAIAAARKRWENALRGDGEGKTNPLRFRELLRLSRDNPREFAQVDLYGEPLSNSALKDMLGRQDDVTAGRDLKPFSLETTQAAVDRIYERATGVNLNSKKLKEAERDRYQKFVDVVTGEVNARQALSAKPLDQQQIEEIARKQLVDRTVVTPRDYWFDRSDTLKQFERAEEEIPPAVRDRLVAGLRARGEAVTPQNIYRGWVAYQEITKGNP